MKIWPQGGTTCMAPTSGQICNSWDNFRSRSQFLVRCASGNVSSTKGFLTGGCSGLQYIDMNYWLSIYWHFWKILISISILIRTIFKISISILIRTFLKISMSISISIRRFYRIDLTLFSCFLMKNLCKLSIYQHFFKYWWNIDTYCDNININKILIQCFQKYWYQ